MTALRDLVRLAWYVARNFHTLLADHLNRLVRDVHAPDPASIPDRDPYAPEDAWLTEAQPHVRCRLDGKPWPCKAWLSADDSLAFDEAVRCTNCGHRRAHHIDPGGCTVGACPCLAVS